MMRSCAACMSTITRPLFVLREHVDAGELREGEAERRGLLAARPAAADPAVLAREPNSVS